jgi:hypothetical protein
MATSSRQSALFGINDWKAIYQTFREADFQSYDYETLRKSFIDYLRVYYPETYNDYIESSEFIALLDVMAFMGQGLAFRNDLNARENFIDTAERRDSVVKLANLVSYTPKRNLEAQGLLKVTSIQTTQNLVDFNGVNLSNLTVLWNDPANPNWFEQFNTIINAALVDSQRIGRPGNIAEILGVTTAEYALQIPAESLPIVPFTSTVDGITMGFELVSVTSVDEDYLYEIPPAPTGRFNMVYQNDRLGFASPNTGYFFYFKQGSLTNFDFVLEQQIANQAVNIDIQGINNEDTWLYQLNLNNNTRTLWRKVDNVYANAYLQTETSKKSIFSVSSRFNDQVTYNFGDGVFSNIPVGTFRAYVRSSNGLTYTIDPSEMQGINVAFNYITRQGKVETLAIGLQLTQPVSNAQARESLPSIKQRAPTRYYTQNRMVNGEDYNNFPYTLYSSIIKSKAINRSSVGVSKNLDLLDPTGKYSSTNTFADDGSIWENNEDTVLTLAINNTPSDIIAFITDTLASVLALNRSNQYYINQSSDSITAWYKRFDLPTNAADPETGSQVMYWASSTVDANSQTGYFYNLDQGSEVPAFVGIFSTTNAKYVTKGALIKFRAPDNYYFDNNNRLVEGISGPNKPNTLWTTVLNVIGDGTNTGQGQFSNGTGPVTLNGYVPAECILEQIIPAFDNSLPVEVVQDAIIKMELQQSFSLVFNNSLLINQNRWIVRPVNDSNWFVKFVSDPAINRYTITVKSLKYYFGSVSETRFTFATNEIVYDPFSGKILQDFVNVLGINTQPESLDALGRDYKVNIVGQTVETDGYVNDFQVEISATDINNKQLILNPDFFTTITGVTSDGNNAGFYVFFETVQDPINLTRLQLVPVNTINFQYSTKNEIEDVKYEYPVGQLFFANQEPLESNPAIKGVFYKTVQDTSVTTISYQLVIQDQFSFKYGRQGLSYQYRHNSNNTTRIDPATTNIIDLYVVTQSYYTAYQNYIQDSTNTVPKPSTPTIAELSASYGKVQDYKMLSDSVVLNSVVFKPLFGPKADPALRGTIKVIKTNTTTASDSEIRSAVLTAMNTYFDINNWNFGDTFFFSELSAYLHNQLGDLISSAVLVPNNPNEPFGTLYEIKSAPYEIFVNGAVAENILVIAALTPNELQIA